MKDAAIATERKTPTPAAISAGVAAAAAAIATTAAVVQPADEKKMEPQPVEESKAVEEPAVAVVEVRCRIIQAVHMYMFPCFLHTLQQISRRADLSFD